MVSRHIESTDYRLLTAVRFSIAAMLSPTNGLAETEELTEPKRLGETGDNNQSA
jgi:hypothetical protein